MNGTNMNTSKAALVSWYSRTVFCNRPAGATRSNAIAISRFSHDHAGAFTS